MRNKLSKELSGLASGILAISSLSVTGVNISAKEETYPHYRITSEEAAEYGVAFYTDKKTGITYAGCLNDSVKDLVIPGYIDDHEVTVFYIDDHSGLETVTIPDTVTSIERINGCPSIKEFIVDENNSSYCSKDGVLYTQDGSVLLNYPAAKSGDSFTVPDGVEKIEDNGFSDSSLSVIELPESLTYIGMCAFSNDRSLREIVIPAGVGGALPGSFYGCDSLETVTFLREDIMADPLYFIMDYTEAFEGCDNCLTVYVPDSAIEDYKAALANTLTNGVILPLSVKQVETKSWDYFCALSDEEVLQQYRNYRELIGDPIPEISYEENGVIINDIVAWMNWKIAYGGMAYDAVEVWSSTLIDDRYDEVSSQPSDYFGFPKDSMVECAINKPKIRINNYNLQLAGKKEDAYDVMRYVLTVANSQFWSDYYNEEEGADVGVVYLSGESNTLSGDANGDAKLNLNDAVAILQYVALPQKYPLQSFLLEAADCDGVPGITGGDALWIQQQDALST